VKEKWREEYRVLADGLAERGQDVESIKDSLKQQEVETPSWGYGNAGTRFQVFPQAGAPRNAFEKLEDAAVVHRLTGICPAVAIHIPWDQVGDYGELRRFAESLGLRIGAVNPNLFQDFDYKLGSLCHPNAEVRRRAVEHILECIEIAEDVDSRAISLWLADGTNYAGQGHFRSRKRWLEETLRVVYDRLPVHTRLLIEYKFFEPGFYHTDLADWGMAYNAACKLGDQAQVLVDLGHHPQGTNVEHIVAYLLSESKLGGFHFNNRKYADDDLMVGSVNPFELFLVYNELVDAAQDPELDADVAFMIDQSHNVEARIPAMIQSLVNVQSAYAKALLVDRTTLRQAQEEGNVMAAHNVLADAFQTDVRPLLRHVREEMGLPPDPLVAYAESGYAEKIAAERVGGGRSGWSYGGAN
jgi:L-rhamnose isomerase/sugar isomerase